MQLFAWMFLSMLCVPFGIVVQAQELGEPVAPSFYPATILNWNPTNDPDAFYNKSTIPLAMRFVNPALNVNPHSRTNEAGVMSLVAFNSTPVSSAEGSRTNRFYAGNYWQYMKSMVYWGGSAGSGILLVPNGHVIDAAHRNGVMMMGNVFFPPTVYGGKFQWVNDFLQQSGTNFPVADKLIQAAQYFGFDGWFINQETVGGSSATASAMTNFINYFHAKAPGLKIVWYDAMDKNGSIDYRNELDSYNQMFFQGVSGPVSDNMFLNFWWGSHYGDTTELPNSRSLAQSLGRSPYDLYAGIDTESGGYTTTGIDWYYLFPEGQPHLVSLGIYRPEWTFNYASSVTNFYARDNYYWVGPGGDPSNTSSNNAWPGISHFIPAASPISNMPFTTSFNPGQGSFFNINGQQLMNGGWNNLGLQDVLPTWRWLVKSTGTKLVPSIDFVDAYYGSASLLVAGTVTSATNDIWLYQTSLAVSNNTHVRFIYKTGLIGATYLKLGLAFEDSPTNFQFLDIGNTVTTGWNTNTLDLSVFAGKKISTISLRIGNATTVGSYSLRVGQLSVYNGSISTPAAPASVAVDKLYNLDWKTYNLRLTWSNSTDAVYYYNVYRRNPNNSLSWLWATPNNGVFISQLARSNNEAFTPIEVEAVGMDYGVSAHATYNFQWIDPVTIPLTNSDAVGVSSFNSGLNWSNSLAPTATNIYQVSGLDLRTPAVGGDQIFAGGALYLTNGGALRIKATGSGNVTTIGAAPGTALFLGGGVVSDWSGLPETLAGYVSLIGTGNLFDPQANLFTVASQISGGGTLTVDAPGGITGGTLLLTGANTYTNGTVLNAADTVQLSGSGTLGSGAFLAISNNAAHGFGLVDLNGTSQIIGALLGTGGVITNGSSNSVSLTVGSGNSSGSFSGKLVSSSARPLMLNKTGSGTQTLAGDSSVASLNIALNNSSSPMTNGSVVVPANTSVSIGSGSSDSISIAAGNFGAASFGTLDVSASSNFTVNVGSIQVGVNAQNPGGNFPWTGTLNLGTNNTISASTSITIGDAASAFNAASSQAVLTTAPNGITTILTPTLILGARKCNPTFTYGSGAVFNVGSTGSRTALSIGNSAALGQLGTGTTFMSSNNFAAGTFVGNLSSLTIGTINNTGGGGQVGALILGNSAANHLDISRAGSVVVLGRNLLGGGVGTATGVLTITNLDGTSVVASTDNSTAILLGATTQSAGTLNLNGGTLKITTTGSGIAGGTGTSTLNLNGVKFIAGANSASFITNLTTATVNPGGVMFDTANFNITIAQALANGAGGLSKLGAGRLTLSKANAYAGNTTIGAGTLTLVEPGNIASSAQIIISNTAVMDVTGRTDRTLTLNSGKTLRGSGTLLGKLNAVGGSTINPGDVIGTLVVQSNITLAGAVVMELNRTNAQPNDQLISTNGTIAGGGTLTVNNLGPALEGGDVFVLFNQAVSGFATVNLPALTAGNAWQSNLAVDGSLRVVSTNAVNLTIGAVANQLTLVWPVDHVGWRLQTQTNSLTAGLATNWVDVAGSDVTNAIILPVDLTEGGTFFRLTYP